MKPEERKPIAIAAGSYLLFWLIIAALWFLPSCDEPTQVQEPDPHGGSDCLTLDVPAGGGG